MIKEQRSISFSQTERDRQQQFHKGLQKPPTTKQKELQISARNLNEDSQQTVIIPNLNLHQKKNPLHLNLDSFKSCDSQNNDTLVIAVQSQNDHIYDGQEQLLASQRSMKTLKSLQSERYNRKASKKRSETREGFTNDINFQINQSGIKGDNDSMIYFESSNFNVSHRRNNRDQSIDQVKIEQLQSMAVLYSKNKVSDYEIDSQGNHHRKKSKSSASLNKDEGQRMIKQWQHFKKTSMVQGERDSLDGCNSEHSQLDIPNEHLTQQCQLTTSTNNSKLNSGNKIPPNKNSSEKKGTQRNRQGPQSQNPISRQTQAIPNSRVKLFNINTVRDSSPLKTIGLFNNNIRDSQSHKGGSISDRQQTNEQIQMNQIKMFAQKTQFINTFKQPAQADSTYKQPKQGNKKAQQYIPSQRHNQAQQYQTQNSPQVPLRDSLLKNTANQSNMYLTQANGSFMKKAQEQIESDFVNSQEEDDFDKLASQYQSNGIFASHQESTFTTGQSFHLPQSQALGINKKTNNIQGLSSKINNLNIRAGNPIKNQPIQDDIQPITGNLNDKVSPGHSRRGLHILETQNKTQQSTQNQRVASNFRNESLERILGDKANLLFDQIDKIQNKEYVKLNRSLLQCSNDRGDSSNRNMYHHTPMLIQGNTQDLEQKEIVKSNTNNVQRKRQLTFTDGNQSQHLRQIQQQLMQQLPKQMSNFANNRNKTTRNEGIAQHQSTFTIITDPDEAIVVNTERKGKEIASSPGHFPSSVKDKIKNITQRIKQEVQKNEEQTHHNINIKDLQIKRKSHQQQQNMSVQQLNDNTQNSIKSAQVTGNFKKYLNGEQADKTQLIKNEAKNLKQSNIKKPRNSNIENRFDNKKGKIKNKSIIGEQFDSHHRQPLKKQDQQSINNMNNHNLSPPRQVEVSKQSSMFQRRKLSQNGKQNPNKLIKSQNNTNSLNLKDSIHGKENVSKKGKHEIECIIYVPNHPPEVLTSNDLLQIDKQQKEEQQQQIQLSQQHQQQVKMQQIHNIKGQNTFITPEPISNRKDNIILSSQSPQIMNEDQQENNQFKSEEKIDENFIKNKFHNLLKETRQKIRDNDKIHHRDFQINQQFTQQQVPNQSYNTPRGITTVNNHQFSSVNSNGKNSPKNSGTLQKSEDQLLSSKFTSMRKSHLGNQALSNSQTPRSDLKTNSNNLLQQQQQQQNIQVQVHEVASKLNFEKQAHNMTNDMHLYKQSMLIPMSDAFGKMRASLDQQNLVNINQQKGSMDELNYQQQMQQQQQQMKIYQQQQQIQPPLYNRYMSQINDLHSNQMCQFQPQNYHQQLQIQSPQFNGNLCNSNQQQNLMFNFRQQIPSYVSQDCQAHCKCHLQMNQQFNCQSQQHQMNLNNPMMQQSSYMSQTLSPQINQNYPNIQQQIQQPDFFNNYLSQQQYHNYMPHLMQQQQYQYSPMLQNQMYSQPSLQQQPLFQASQQSQNMININQHFNSSQTAGLNSYDNSQIKTPYDQLSKSKQNAMTQENLMKFNQQHNDLQSQSLGLQLVNALNEFDKLDEMDG